MKKLISFLGIISITASTGSVAACSTVNNIKTSIKNKIQNLTQVSSTALRGAMIQNASQDTLAANELAYDADYLTGLINSGKAKTLMPGFKTDSETTVGSLMKNYFNGQNINRNEINNLSKSENPSYSDSAFLTDQVKSPVGSADSLGSMLTLIISAIKSNGGVHPSLSGLIQGLLPELGLSPSAASGVGPMEDISKLLDSAAVPLAILIKALSGSNLAYSLISNLLNANFLNDSKEGKTNITNGLMSALSSVNFVPLIIGLLELMNHFDILIPTFDMLVNSVLTMDKVENMTNKQVMNATNRRLYNVFAALSGQTDKIVKDVNVLYSDVDYTFEKDFGELMGVFFENLNNINTSNITLVITDLLFVVTGLLQRITSVDFGGFKPSNNQNLFSESDKNIDYLKLLGSNNFKRFETKLLFKNLSIALNSDSEGLNTAKLFSLLFESGSEKIVNLDKPGFGGWTIKITGFLLGLGGYYEGSEGLSSLIFALGYGIGKWQNINYTVLGIGVGPVQVGNILKGAIDNFVENRSISGLDSLFDFIKTFGVNVPFRFKNDKLLKESWKALWSKESTFLKTVIGGENNISLETILAGPVYEGKTISEILDFIYNAINSSTPNNQKLKELEQETKGMANGLQDISKALSDTKYSIFTKNGNAYNGTGSNAENKYTALQVLMITSGLNGLYISVDGVKNTSITGAKAAMYALGTNFDANGKQLGEFRQDSLLSGLEKIVDDKSVDSLLDQIVKGFAEVNSVKNNLSNTVYKPLIQDNNFKTKVESHYGIDQGMDEAGITYTTTYKDPNTKKTFNYEIKLLLEAGALDWQIKSIKRK
ncbi:hypothetical protein [Spiroplasma endosymbiont of Diplazon laetatorius]|uniref:hypothetical protein n=1 Tax=Spiroplasma endosymbiont of Diplazon laetatorius TaxID=3066322 RepID=UPI0030CE18D0